MYGVGGLDDVTFFGDVLGIIQSSHIKGALYRIQILCRRYVCMYVCMYKLYFPTVKT